MAVHERMDRERADGAAPMICEVHVGGRSSVVERQLPKLNVVGSIPIARSSTPFQ
jgi:hypothetical protein